MTIEEILSLKDQNGGMDNNAIVNELKSKRYTEMPDIETYAGQIDPLKHEVFDKTKRKDKPVRISKDDPRYNANQSTGTAADDKKKTGWRTEPVARVALAIQKLIVKRAVSFIFGNPVNLDCTTNTDNEKTILKAVQKIMYDNKDKSLNRKIARNLFSCTEVAEYWYPIPVDKTKTGTGFVAKVKDAINNVIGNKYHESYGFKSTFKLRCAVFSPLLGDVLYPYFDETGDMTAFSRQFTRTVAKDKKKTYFETYTADMHIMWEIDGAYTIVEGYPRELKIGRIPIVYGTQPQVEWADVQNLIERLEKLLSNFADTNDYHASPKIFVKGKLTGFANKGESGAILQGDADTDAKYLSWDNAPEAVKLEIETLLKMIYTITQTPDISFDAVKGIGNVSGVALKLMFMDAHLKVAEHQEVFDEYLQRRINVVKAFIGQMNTSLANDAENLIIEPVITPYMIVDEVEEIKVWTEANGGNPVMSQKASFHRAGLTSDPEADYEQYIAEQDRANTFNIGQPTM